MLATQPLMTRGNVFVEFICEHRKEYYHLAYSFMGNEADAMDAVSQMTLVVMEKYYMLRSDDSFFAWSKKILVNICRDKLKEKKRVMPLEAPLEMASSSDKDADEAIVIRQAINKLAPKYKEIIILRYFLDYEYKDIAQILAIPDGTVKSRLNRGIAALKELMKGDGHESR